MEVIVRQLVFGKNQQVKFNTEEELEEAIYYLKTSSNIEFVHENNQDQGAWGPEDRIHFFTEDGIPECLKRQLTKGNGTLYGRINCKEFCEYIKSL